MPIDIETFEAAPRGPPHAHWEGSNADRVMRFLATYPDQAFTQIGEIRDATDVNAGSISVVLSSSRRSRTRPPRRQLLDAR